MVQDGNPAYWDAEFATQVWGGLVAPPALLMGWLIPPPWLPDGQRPIPSIAIRVPLPGTTFINASNDVELVTPIVEGDRLKVVEEVVSVSPEKRTKVGVGHFVETCDSYYREDGVPGRDEPKHVVPLHPDGVAVTTYRSWRGTMSWCRPTSPEVVDEISYQRVVMNPGATWDYFPGHYDPPTPKATGIQRFSSTPCISRVSSTGSRPTGPGPTAGWCGARCR